MSASTLRAAAALIRHEWPNDPIHRAAANLFDTVLKVGPVDGGAEWDATVNLARTYLGDESSASLSRWSGHSSTPKPSHSSSPPPSPTSPSSSPKPMTASSSKSSW
jgi:hypothetical protein